MTIHVENETKQELDFPYEELIRQVVCGALDVIECPYECEVAVLLTDDDAIKEMNQIHRGIDKATDVLSFPMAEYSSPGDFDALEEEQPDVFHPDTGELLLGDIVISLDHVASQAVEYGHSKERELGFLVAHSVLHLCGYDHMEDEERAIMEQKQRDIMDVLKLYR